MEHIADALETGSGVGYVLERHAGGDKLKALLLPVAIDLRGAHGMVFNSQRVLLLMYPGISDELFGDVYADDTRALPGEFAREVSLPAAEIEHSQIPDRLADSEQGRAVNLPAK